MVLGRRPSGSQIATIYKEILSRADIDVAHPNDALCALTAASAIDAEKCTHDR